MTHQVYDIDSIFFFCSFATTTKSWQEKESMPREKEKTKKQTTTTCACWDGESWRMNGTKSGGKKKAKRLFYSNCESKMYDSVRLLSSFMQSSYLTILFTVPNKQTRQMWKNNICLGWARFLSLSRTHTNTSWMRLACFILKYWHYVYTRFGRSHSSWDKMCDAH